MKILIGFASAHGSTRQIADFIGRVLRAYNVDVTVAALSNIDDASGYDAVILGSPIHAGMWLQDMSLAFERLMPQIVGKAHLFITCIRVMEENGREVCLQDYLYHPTLKQAAIPLEAVGVFAGKLEVSTLSWNERWLLASNYDGTEASKHAYHDYRDWAAIASWTTAIAARLALKPSFE
jgi:menaquinone-dependent protoporphyrinogen oxidase